jgi:hypothetical protein
MLADAVAARLGDRDELVALSPAPLAAMGLEHAAVLRLVATGNLKAVKVGRRVFTKRSYLLSLVDELPPVRQRGPTVAPGDALREALAKIAERQRRKAERMTGAARPRGKGT